MESFKDVFELVKLQCKKRVNDMGYSLWIKDIQPIDLTSSTAILGVTTNFKKKILLEKYASIILEEFENVLGFSVELEIRSEELSPSKENLAFELSSNPAKLESLEEAPSGNYEYTFKTFIVGPSNKFAHAASLAVASNPANAYNPLFIYGMSGLGKTHLLYAISNEIKKNSPNENIIYVKGEEFTNELINAIKTEKTKAFHDKYREADVLLIDDIQFIGGKESTQEEFFHTFNTLHQANKQIVLASDRTPKEIKTLEDRLRTRFEWGLIADVQTPDFETRIAIIRRKAELLNFKITDDVSEHLANKLKTNIRQLEGAVKKMHAYHTLTGAPCSIALAQEAIKDILNDEQPIPVTVERIISEVGRTFNVSPADIKSNKRSANISYARQSAIYIIRTITQMSMSAIGEEFGGRDHSTVIYALAQVEKNFKSDYKYRESIEDIIKNIKNS